MKEKFDNLVNIAPVIYDSPISRLDFFAGLAMVGLIVSTAKQENGDFIFPKALQESSITMAKALIEELDKER